MEEQNKNNPLTHQLPKNPFRQFFDLFLIQICTLFNEFVIDFEGWFSFGILTKEEITFVF